MDLSVLLYMPFPIEAVSPKWTNVGVGLVIPFAVGAFEQVRARFTLLGFQPRWVNFSIGFATPSKFSMVLQLVRAITFDAFGPLDSTREG